MGRARRARSEFRVRMGIILCSEPSGSAASSQGGEGYVLEPPIALTHRRPAGSACFNSGPARRPSGGSGTDRTVNSFAGVHLGAACDIRRQSPPGVSGTEPLVDGTITPPPGPKGGRWTAITRRNGGFHSRYWRTRHPAVQGPAEDKRYRLCNMTPTSAPSTTGVVTGAAPDVAG